MRSSLLLKTLPLCLVLAACPSEAPPLGDLQCADGEHPTWNAASAAWVCTAPATEQDPAFAASSAATITGANLTSWNEAHGWGDHSSAGYLLSETDPSFSTSAAASITSSNVTSWSQAYAWGNHGSAGYLLTEADPSFSSSVAATITGADVTNWGQAYLWGNHAMAGYLLTEADPSFSSSAAATITNGNKTNWNTAYSWGDHADAGYLLTETDPAFSSSAAATITSGNTVDWSQAFAWGNHALAGYLTTETDPAFSSSPSATITNANKTNWNTAFGWGNHADAGYLKTETDPVFTASPSGTITNTNKTNWNTAFGWGNHGAQGYLRSTDPVAKATSNYLQIRAVSRGLLAPGAIVAGVSVNGTQVLNTGRSYGLVAINRTTGAVTRAQSYDVFGNLADADLLATHLAAYDAATIVIITTTDEPQANRLGTANALRTQILRCGGTFERFNNDIKYRSAYLLVGVCGDGAGSGLELYSGTVNDAGDAAVEANFKIIDGRLQDLPPQIVTLAPTTAFALSSSNAFATMSGLTYTFTLSRPTLVQAAYSISMGAGSVVPSQHLVTRLVVTREAGAVDVTNYPVESTVITGNTAYWDNRGGHSAVFGPGQFTVAVEYRTPAGGSMNPASTDYEHRQLTLRFDTL